MQNVSSSQQSKRTHTHTQNAEGATLNRSDKGHLSPVVTPKTLTPAHHATQENHNRQYARCRQMKTEQNEKANTRPHTQSCTQPNTTFLALCPALPTTHPTRHGTSHTIASAADRSVGAALKVVEADRTGTALALGMCPVYLTGTQSAPITTGAHNSHITKQQQTLTASRGPVKAKQQKQGRPQQARAQHQRRYGCRSKGRPP